MLVRKVATRIEYACSGKLPSTTQMINDRMWLCERAGIDKSEARNSAARILFIEKVIKEELAQAIEELRLLLESFGFSKDQTIAKMNAIVFSLPMCSIALISIAPNPASLCFSILKPCRRIGPMMKSICQRWMSKVAGQRRQPK